MTGSFVTIVWKFSSLGDAKTLECRCVLALDQLPIRPRRRVPQQVVAHELVAAGAQERPNVQPLQRRDLSCD